MTLQVTDASGNTTSCATTVTIAVSASVTANNLTKVIGSANPPLTVTTNGLINGDVLTTYITPDLITPSSPKQFIDNLARDYTFTNIKLNNTSNVFFATPGQSITLTGSWTWIYNPPIPANGCPGCIAQAYFGMANAEGSGNVWNDCNNVTGTGSGGGALNRTFNAPTQPGVYYISLNVAWDNGCNNPERNPINDPSRAFAVVIVQPTATPSIFISTTATTSSPAGTYPITITVKNAGGYNISKTDGTLTITSSFNETILENRVAPFKTNIGNFTVTMYPNPAQSDVTMVLNGLDQDAELIIFDMQGKKVLGRKVYAGTEKLTIDIAVNELTNGMYLIMVDKAGERLYQKMMISR